MCQQNQEVVKLDVCDPVNIPHGLKVVKLSVLNLILISNVAFPPESRTTKLLSCNVLTYLPNDQKAVKLSAPTLDYTTILFVRQKGH